MHSLAYIDIAKTHLSELERSLNSRLTTAVSVAEAPRALEPVARDPFIDALEPATSVEDAALDAGNAGPKAARDTHERKRSRVLASLLIAALCMAIIFLVVPSTGAAQRRPPETLDFAAQWPSLHVPLSTLRRRPHGRQRMTRGHRGSLLLQCRTLSFLSPCRFIPAL